MKNKKILFGLNKNIQSSILMALVFLGVFFLVNIKNASAESCSEQFGSGYTCANPDNTEAGADCKDGNGCPGPGNSNLKCCLTSKVKVPGPTDTMPCPANFGCVEAKNVSESNLSKCSKSCSTQTFSNGTCCPLSLFPQGGSAPSTPSAQPKHFNYILLESFPGFFNAGDPLTDLPAMILAIYKFGIWTVGIAGLFMLVIGGFMYMTSAGNTSTAGSARGIIWDALIGIVAALGAYLILYVINPDLTKLNLSFTSVNIKDMPIGVGGGGGKCVPVTKAGSACVVDQLSMFGSNATKASSICKIESGGDANLASNVDKCQDGNAFSIGLFQINMIDSAPSICNANGEIFTTGTKKGSCLSKNAEGTCVKWSCQVKDKAKYDECVAKLKNPTTNISVAKEISKTGASWTRWGANSICKF